MTQTAPVEQTQRRSRLEHGSFALTAVGLIVAILGTIAAWLALKPDGGAPTTTTTSATTASVATPGAQASAAQTYLRDLAPVAGRANLVTPAELESKPELEHSVVIRCHAPGSGDNFTEVKYKVTRAYRSFTAQFVPYLPLAVGTAVTTKIQVTIFLNSSVDDVVSSETRLTPTVQYVGKQTAISESVRDAYYVKLRITCEEPDGFVILQDAAFAS